ncbi:MAG: hypothetical protein AMS18_15845 [Gemmatimonas sp. SG8_17]|nr:MAG: hypothetical protein AMS18_15845 [Gemmatimonas sp. SG8_17]
MTIHHIGDFEKLIRDVRENPALERELLDDPLGFLERYALTEAEKVELRGMTKIEIHLDDESVRHVVIPEVKPIGPRFICC